VLARVLLIGLSLLVSNIGVAQVTFGSPTDFSVGAVPRAVAVGDFNNDGKGDLAVANSVGNDVSILLGRGDGTFEAAVNYHVGLNPVSITVVDLNLDNKVDLAVAFHGDYDTGQPGGISLLLANGDGTFQPASTVSLNWYPSYMAAGDFNGDHDPDLVVAGANSADSVSVFLGNGDGTFQAPVSYDVTGVASSVAVGDFNDDAKQDLVVTTSYARSERLLGKVIVFRGKGDGSFQSLEAPGDGGVPSWSVAVGDFNGDHRLDLASITKMNVFQPPFTVATYGKGDGTFGGGAPIDGSNFDSFVTAGDLNADGLSDLVALSFAVVPAARVFLSRGDGKFQLAQTVVFNNFGPGAAAIGDFNGDHLPDLAVTMPPLNVVSILLNTTSDFTLSLSALTPEKIVPGGSATATLTAGGANGFNGSVSFSCSVSPKPQFAPQCSVSPSSVTLGRPATLTIATVASQAAMKTPSGDSKLFYALWFPVWGLTLMKMVFPTRRKERRLPGILLCGSLFVTLLLLPSCGGGSSGGGTHGSAGTPPGAYTITVTGTSGMAHSTMATLRVQ
jgi:hypothetical protein